LTPLTPRSLREEARLALRAGIITGEIAAGELYSVPSLAEKLGVSATPVREAMLDLANEGLVEPVRNRGFRVIRFDEHDLDEIFHLRLLLEAPSVRQVAGKLPPDLERRLQDLVVELERSAEAGDLPRYLTADHQFHLGATDAHEPAVLDQHGGLLAPFPGRAVEQGHADDGDHAQPFPSSSASAIPAQIPRV
jgi:DNA-binding GntR family transcriptional regulator